MTTLATSARSAEASESYWIASVGDLPYYSNPTKKPEQFRNLLLLLSYVVLIINFKTYPQALGPDAVALAKELEKTAEQYLRVEVGFAPPAFELPRVVESVKNPVWAQHLDPAGEGQFTGYLAPSSARKSGAFGTFLNHSEHKTQKEEIKKTTTLCRELGLKVLVFANSPTRVEEFTGLNPDFIAYEPPELIGGEVSVTNAKPEVIKDAVSASEDIPLFVGAGIHEKRDIEVALSLGAAGAVVSSAVVKAKDPAKVFADLLSGFKV
ncbi:triose-phosphate isomerase [Candidatus Saccharibacteria bacterium]|nr:triose-phosphate isomerase [Candidatus Saccharibacteria bacterium]